MLVIGERLNSSIKSVENAIKNKDSTFIKQEVMRQLQAGAHMIDLNAGIFIKSESEELVWMIRTMQSVGAEVEGVGIALDSSNPLVIEAGLEELVKINKARNSIINSVTAEKEKLDKILPLVKRFETKFVGMCMGAQGIPDVPEERRRLGMEIVQAAEEHGIPRENIYLDPLVVPVSTDVKKGLLALETIKLLKSEEPEVLTMLGLSNISYGLPMKNILNRTFLAMAMAAGLDAAILNPLDPQLMSTIKAADVLLARDDYCMNYINAYRKGEL